MNDPKIIYTVVCYKKTILCEFYERSGDIIDYIRDRVIPVTGQQGKRIINEETMDHLYVRDQDQIMILATTDSDFNKEVGFQYIQDIKEQIQKTYTVDQLKRASKNSLSDIKDYISNNVKEFNLKWMDKAKIARIKANIAKDAITINMKNIQERNLQFNQMEDSSELISESSQILMENANKLKKKAQREYYKAICIYVGLALIALYILLTIICSGFTLSGCFQQIIDLKFKNFLYENIQSYLKKIEDNFY